MAFLLFKNGKVTRHKSRQPKKGKKWSFLGRWRNGDSMNVCVYGKTRKEAWFRLLKCKKEKKFEYNKGDNFQVFNKTLDDPGVSFFAGGHTAYIVDEKGNVDFN